MILLGVLCGGLLLAGIGAGICAFELSGFSYGGSVVPMGERATVTDTFRGGGGNCTGAAAVPPVRQPGTAGCS
ncbi:secreted protein, partial [gut metagenome]